MRRVEIISVECKFCGKEFKKRITSNQKFCSKACKNDYMRGKTFEELHGIERSKTIKDKLSKSCSGENNPNYGNSWSEEQKKNQAIKVKNILDNLGEEWRKETLGKSNRGLVRSKEFIKNWHANNHGHPHTEESKLIIGKKSKEKFNDKYNSEFRKTMELLGHWIPLCELSDFKIYEKESSWVEKMWDKIKIPDDFNDVGIFNAVSNVHGYVRDHRISKMGGFILKIFPELLRHPVNCECLSHVENSRKKSNSSIDLPTLFSEIKSYEGDWKEQDVCLELIRIYESGKKWERLYE